MHSNRVLSSKRLLSGLITTIVVTTACSTTGSTPTGSEPPVRGGTLTFARSQDTFTWDIPAILDDPSIFTSLQVNDRLVKLAPDLKSVEPELATSWQIANDGLSATFKIRPGVKFSDGTPLTMDDITFSLTRDFDPKGNWGFLFTGVKGVAKVDESTVRIDLSAPFSPLLLALSTFAAGIVSKANAQKWGDKIGEHPLGTGPFFLEKWTRGSQIVLSRNPNYWQSGKPYLDKIIFNDIGDDNARVLQLQAGAADVIDAVPTAQVNSLSTGSTRLVRVDGTALRWLLMNLKKKPFNEQAVRCAMAYSLDRQSIAKLADQGASTPAKSILPTTTAYYSDANAITFDINKAKQLLSQSSVPNGFTFDTYVAAGDSGANATAQVWADALKGLNVHVNIRQIESTTLQQLQNNGNFTTAIKYWTNDTPDPDEQWGADATLGIGWNDPRMDAEIAAARAEPDPSKRDQMYAALQQEMNTKCYIGYIVDLPRLYATTTKVHGFMPNAQGKYGFENVWKSA